MNTFVVSGLLLFALLVIAIFWLRFRPKKRLPYDLRETLLSPEEHAFLRVLEMAVGDKVRVFAKVQVAEVLTPEAGLGKSKWQQHLGKISGKHFDYLLCHPADLSFICAIEIGDSTHRHQKRKVRDSVLQTACDSAGLPLLQIADRGHGLEQELRELILPLLIKRSEPVVDAPIPGQRREPTFNPLLLDGVDVGTGSHARAAPESIATAGAQLPAGSSRHSKWTAELPAMEGDLAEGLFIDTEDDEEQEVHHCPRCDAPLLEREAKKGPHAGQLFLACSRFPDCRYAAPHHRHPH